MDDHYDGHYEGEDVDEGGGALEDYGVCEEDCAGVADWLDAGGVCAGGGADEGAEGEGRLLAYGLQVAEAHGGRVVRGAQVGGGGGGCGGLVMGNERLLVVARSVELSGQVVG